MSGGQAIPRGTESELRRFWPAVLACFATALFGWGFGFTGPSVYLAELQRLRGWPAGTIAAAITVYYLLGAVFLTRIDVALRWLGPRRLLGVSTILPGLGASAFCLSSRVWELFPAAAIMALGWAGCTTTAIATTLAQYFQRQRGAAISLALNGASAAGFTVAPCWWALARALALARPFPSPPGRCSSFCCPCWGWPFGIAAPKHHGGPAALSAPDPGVATVLRRWHFWSVALPFALALAAQVGLVVHLVSFLQPRLGPAGAATALALVSGAAMAGRLLLSTVIDRLHQRRVAAISIASQALAVGLMLSFPHWAGALYVGCVVFGASVGNLITIPSLIVQREFPETSFGLIVALSTAIGQFTYALAPALLGVIREATGSYASVLGTCIALQLDAALLVLAPARPAPAVA
jgi:predicted MFS family arabinose efflux permease